jgi:hypothetical protein
VARRTHLHGEFLSYLNVFHVIGVRERGKGERRNQDACLAPFSFLTVLGAPLLKGVEERGCARRNSDPKILKMPTAEN